MVKLKTKIWRELFKEAIKTARKSCAMERKKTPSKTCLLSSGLKLFLNGKALLITPKGYVIEERELVDLYLLSDLTNLSAEVINYLDIVITEALQLPVSQLEELLDKKEQMLSVYFKYEEVTTQFIATLTQININNLYAELSAHTILLSKNIKERNIEDLIDAVISLLVTHNKIIPSDSDSLKIDLLAWHVANKYLDGKSLILLCICHLYTLDDVYQLLMITKPYLKAPIEFNSLLESQICPSGLY
jgi:hypothetical protein